MRNLSSSAADSVKVKAMISSLGYLPSTATHHATRRAMTSVLPDPAPATTSRRRDSLRDGFLLFRVETGQKEPAWLRPGIWASTFAPSPGLSRRRRGSIDLPAERPRMVFRELGRKGVSYQQRRRIAPPGQIELIREPGSPAGVPPLEG